MKIEFALATALALTLVLTGPAAAKAPAKTPSKAAVKAAVKAPTKAPSATVMAIGHARCPTAVTVGKDGRLKLGDDKVNDLGCTEVDAKPARPSVHYILGRATIAYFGIRLERNFTRSIIEASRVNLF